MNFYKTILLCSLMLPTAAMAGDKLTGTPIGTSAGFNYENWSVEYDVQYRAFDGDLNTYFATDARSYTWVGLDLGTPHVIDRVGWSPRNDGLGPKRVQLGVIQGANSPDFMDALPIYIITEPGIIGSMSYGDVDCSKGFRYVRFVSTGDSRCNIAELEFYGNTGDGDDSHLFQVTNLPTVVVNTLNAEEPYDKEHDITANIIIIAGNKADTDKPGTIRERGNASRSFPKKPWRLKFDKKQSVLGSPATAKKWTLINNYGDKTLMRNLLAFEIARRLEMPFVAWARPVDVILNGEYKGCYQLCDQMEVNPGRVDITEMETTDTEGEALGGGYFIEVDAYAYDEPEGEFFISQYGIPVTIKSPDDGGTPEQHNYIRNYFNRMEDLVFRYCFGRDGGEDYRDIFDVESFIKHFIVGELSGNTDTYWSTYMYKDRNDPALHTGPVWDFDLAFDNDIRTYPIHNTAGDFLYRFRQASAANGMHDFANRIIIDDERTASDISRIWSRARNEHELTAGSMMAYTDSLARELDASQQLNFLRWPIMNEWVHQNPQIWGSYAAEVNNVKSYLTQRFNDLDRLMRYDPEYSGVTLPVAPLSGIMLRNGCITYGGDFVVYTPDGRQVFSGSGSTPTLQRGIYIVRSGKAIAKVAVR